MVIEDFHVPLTPKKKTFRLTNQKVFPEVGQAIATLNLQRRFRGTLKFEKLLASKHLAARRVRLKSMQSTEKTQTLALCSYSC